MSWLDRAVSRIRPKSGAASIYGVVLYSDLHPTVKKMVRDPDYMAALSEASGPRWAVFTLSLSPETPGGRGGRRGRGYRLMICFQGTATENLQVSQDFGLDPAKDLPALVVFAPLADGDYSRLVIAIDDSTLESAFSSLREGLQEVSRVLDDVQSETLEDAEATLRKIKRVFAIRKGWNAVKTGARVAERLAGLL